MLVLLLLSLGFSVKAETPYVFEKLEFNIDGVKTLVLWQRLGEPDVIVGYCGVNYVYFDAVTTWWDEILVEWNVSRYVGLRVTNNSERIATYNELKNAFERAKARELGWYGMLDLVYYFEWEPKILGIYAWLGGVEAPREAKINRIKALLNRVSGILEKYNISIVMVEEVDSMIEIEKSAPAAHALVRALNEARVGKSEIPDVVRRYVVEGWWSAGNSLGSVGLAFAQPPPGREDLETLVKWIRDRMGHCEIPLVIAFNVPAPPQEAIVHDIGFKPTTIVTNDVTSAKRSSQHTDISYRYPSTLTPIILLAVLLAITVGLLVAKRIS
jgi:hypothetical protein